MSEPLNKQMKSAHTGKHQLNGRSQSDAPNNLVYDSREDDYDQDPFCNFIFDRLNHKPPDQIKYAPMRQTIFVDKTTNPQLQGAGPGKYSFDYIEESETHWLKTRNTDYGGVISNRSERFDRGRSALDNDTYGATLYHPIQSWANNFDKSIYKQVQHGRLHKQTNWDKYNIPVAIKSKDPAANRRVRGMEFRRNSVKYNGDSDNSSVGNSSVNGSQHWAPKRVFGEIRPHSFFASNSSRNLTFEVGQAHHKKTLSDDEELQHSNDAQVKKTPLVSGVISANIAALNQRDAKESEEESEKEATRVHLHKKFMKKLYSIKGDDLLDITLMKELKISPREGFYQAVNGLSNYKDFTEHIDHGGGGKRMFKKPKRYLTTQQDSPTSTIMNKSSDIDLNPCHSKQEEIDSSDLFLSVNVSPSGRQPLATYPSMSSPLTRISTVNANNSIPSKELKLSVNRYSPGGSYDASVGRTPYVLAPISPPGKREETSQEVSKETMVRTGMLTKSNNPPLNKVVPLQIPDQVSSVVEKKRTPPTESPQVLLSADTVPPINEPYPPTGDTKHTEPEEEDQGLNVEGTGSVHEVSIDPGLSSRESENGFETEKVSEDQTTKKPPLEHTSTSEVAITSKEDKSLFSHSSQARLLTKGAPPPRVASPPYHLKRSPVLPPSPKVSTITGPLLSSPIAGGFGSMNENLDSLLPQKQDNNLFSLQNEASEFNCKTKHSHQTSNVINKHLVKPTRGVVTERLVTPSGRRSFHVGYVGECTGKGLALLSSETLLKNQTDSTNNHHAIQQPRKVKNKTKLAMNYKGNSKYSTVVPAAAAANHIEEDLYDISHDVDVIRSQLVHVKKESADQAPAEDPKFRLNNSNAIISSRVGVLSMSAPSSPLSPAVTTTTTCVHAQVNEHVTCDEPMVSQVNERSLHDDDGNYEDENMKALGSKIEANMTASANEDKIIQESSRPIPSCPPPTPELTVLLLQQSKDNLKPTTKNKTEGAPLSTLKVHPHQSARRASMSSAYRQLSQLHEASVNQGKVHDQDSEKVRPNRASQLRRGSISATTTATSSLRGSVSNKNKNFGGVCGPANVLV